MPNIIESIKQKYSEEIGWSFSFFEGITFIIFLIVIYEILCGSYSSIWETILSKKVSKIITFKDYTLSNARIIDYFLSASSSFITIYIYRKIKLLSFNYLSSIKNLTNYVEKLKTKYSNIDLSNKAMNIHIANEAKEQKKIQLKRITVINGFGLIFLTIIITSAIGLISYNFVDFIMLTVGIIGICFIQWQSFTLYTAQVVPRLILERMAKGEPVEFGDEADQ